MSTAILPERARSWSTTLQRFAAICRCSSSTSMARLGRSTRSAPARATSRSWGQAIPTSQAKWPGSYEENDERGGDVKRWMHALAFGGYALAHARASEAQENVQATTYVVEAGDTCVGISTRFYGDKRFVDLIHSA